MSCPDTDENYIYTSGLDTTGKIGFNHAVKTNIFLNNSYLQMSCQDQMIISIIHSRFNTTG